jgi:hypothetical protein
MSQRSHRLPSLLALLIAATVAGCGPGGVASPLAPLEDEGRLLTWASPITAERLQETPDPLVDGATILSIVSSRHAAGERGHACSVCHYRDTFIAYRPDIDQYATDFIGPHDVVDGRTWSAPGGWAERLLAVGDEPHFEKPEFLRAVFRRWLADGRKFKEELRWNTPLTISTLGEEPNEFVAGGTLVDVINDRISARPDAKLCAECHYPGSVAAYRPPLPEDRDADIGPDDVVDGLPWAGEGGWAEKFIGHDANAELEKPAYLRDVFTIWLADGAR